MPSESPSSSLSFWRLSALRLRASALSASVALAICVDVIALHSPVHLLQLPDVSQLCFGLYHMPFLAAHFSETRCSDVFHQQ